MGRNTFLSSDSELGILTSNTEYLAGYQTRKTNARGYQTVEAFWTLDKPEAGLLTQLTAPEGVTLNIMRDVFGKAVSIERGGVWRTLVYDAEQRLCKTIEAESGATILAYDAVGSLAWRSPGQARPSPVDCDRESVNTAARISFTYDVMNQLISTSYGDGSAGIWRDYWPDGKLKTVASNGSVLSYSYNALGKLETESLGFSGVNYSTARSYNAAGDLASQVSYTNPNWLGLNVHYSPNALGEPQQVSGFASEVAFHPNGALARYMLENGIVHTTIQNIRGLPSVNSDSGVLQDVYAYDQNGNVTAIEDRFSGIFNRAMTYDGLDRLIAANAPNVWGGARYSYDVADNLRSAQVGGRSVAMHYTDGSNRLNSLTINGSTLGIAYDANGNIRSRGGATYTFDLGNRMSASVQGGSYAYDGLGRRTLIQGSDGSTRLNVYGQDGKLMISTSSGGGRPTSGTLYFYLGDKQIAEWDSVSGTQFVHTDALGSPVARTRSLGAASAIRTRFEPFGAVAQGVKPGVTTGLLGFTGHVQDAETDLVYMQQRYYDPIAGRFLSVDPVTTDASTGSLFNRYNYAYNNPYRFKDPDGRFGVAGFLAGAAFEALAQWSVTGSVSD